MSSVFGIFTDVNYSSPTPVDKFVSISALLARKARVNAVVGFLHDSVATSKQPDKSTT
jgi:hypothetical protein